MNKHQKKLDKWFKEKGWEYWSPLSILARLVEETMREIGLEPKGGLAVTGVRALGAITPLGGLAFILGWLALAWAAWTGR